MQKEMKIIVLFVLFLANVNIQAQNVKINKVDKFTKLKEMQTSFEKIVSDPLIMGGQMGRNIWVSFKKVEGANIMIMAELER